MRGSEKLPILFSKRAIAFLFVFVYLLVGGFHAHICFHRGIGLLPGDGAARITAESGRLAVKQATPNFSALTTRVAGSHPCQGFVLHPALPSTLDGFAPETVLKLPSKNLQSRSYRVVDGFAPLFPRPGLALTLLAFPGTDPRIDHIQTVILLI